MILSNGISVMLSILTIIHLSDNNNKYFLNQDKKNISQTFQFWLFVCVVLAFTATIFFTNAFQKSMAQATAEFTLKGNLKDIKKDIRDIIFPGYFNSLCSEAENANIFFKERAHKCRIRGS